ncbi:MAG: hypothetical protein F6K11_28015 [Leptolyngbya sp. SIO3F4]|nr:hypothetical protein [Leptolyngbya sp. SIO3F4]
MIGTIYEMLERAKRLKEKMQGANQDIHFNQLSLITSKDIDEAINQLQNLQSDVQQNGETNLRGFLRRLKDSISQLDYLENWPVAALNRQNPDDASLNSMIIKICREIQFPLTPPVASCMSQQYYFIIPKCNLMCVPLLESDFLLHIPDVYHEFGHLVIDTINNPKVGSFRKKLGRFIGISKVHFQNEIATQRRKSSQIQSKFHHLHNWKDCWAEFWSIELFCDLLAVYCSGPAFGWAHLHLSIKRGGDPFHVPLYSQSEHPADDVRMSAILKALELIGFSQEADAIKEKWEAYIKLSSFSKSPEYYHAYPKGLIEQSVVLALEATKSTKFTLASNDNSGEIYCLLNKAWELFLHSPDKYTIWERQQRKSLKIH